MSRPSRGAQPEGLPAVVAAGLPARRHIRRSAPKQPSSPLWLPMPLRVRILPLALILPLLAACARGDADRRGGAGAGDRDPSAAVPEAERFGGTLVIAATADIGDISPLTWHVQNAL